MAIYSRSQTTVVGLDGIIKAFTRVQEKAASYVLAATEVSANKIKDKAKANLIANKSYKTGDLHNSMQVKQLKVRKAKYSREFEDLSLFSVGPRYATVGARLGKGVNYGHLVELGHKTKAGKQVPAKPYLRPAADDQKEEFIRDVAEAMNAGIEQFGR